MQNNGIITKGEFTEFLLYNTASGEIKVEVFLHNENIRLSQKMMSELFAVDRSVITKHLKNIFESWELEEKSNVQKMHFGYSDKPIKFYNLDVILSVGYRVNSLQATQFRIRATKVLKEYIIKWFAMDDDRLKNWQYFGKDYFQELLERVRSIRASERRIYQKITDIFAECSYDYDKNSDITKNFYAMVQNKFHYAITGQTAAEIIYAEADKNKPYMWLKTRRNAPKGRILKSDTLVAKNYLTEKHIKKLERTISSYFDYIENQIEQRNKFTMAELAESVNKFLEFNNFEILDWKGKISHKKAEEKALGEYDAFNKTQHIESDFDKMIKKLKKE